MSDIGRMGKIISLKNIAVKEFEFVSSQSLPQSGLVLLHIVFSVSSRQGRVPNTKSATYRRAKWHNSSATYLFKPLSGYWVVTGISHDNKTFLYKDLCCLKCCRDVGEKGLLISKDFQLHHLPSASL